MTCNTLRFIPDLFWGTGFTYGMLGTHFTASALKYLIHNLIGEFGTSLGNYYSFTRIIPQGLGTVCQMKIFYRSNLGKKCRLL